MSMQIATSNTLASLPKKKLFYRINEVAKLTGVKPYVLRYWESEFPELDPEKDASDQRRYRAKDIETVLVIRKLLYEDRFTIKGARAQLKQELKAVRSGQISLPLEVATPETSEAPTAKIIEVTKVAEIAPTPVVEVAPKPMSSSMPGSFKDFKTPSLYKRALSENLSKLKKDISELLDLLSA